MNTLKRVRLLRGRSGPGRHILSSLLLILCGTLGATSRTLPNNLASYAGFALMLAIAGGSLVRRSGLLARPASLLPYDFMPLALLAVWLYGLVLGFARGNPPAHVLHNFFGMTLYSIYYVLLWARVRRVALLRCVLIAAFVNAGYMFAFFLFDKGWGRLVSHPTYFRLLDVRAYYSDTLVLLMAPAALIVHRLLTPAPNRPAGVLDRREVASACLLYVYVFAFLQVSLSKATLVTYFLGMIVTIMALGRRMVRLATNGALVRVAVVSGTVLISLYPLTHLLAYVAAPVPASVSDDAPASGASPQSWSGIEETRAKEGHEVLPAGGGALQPSGPGRAIPGAVWNFIEWMQRTIPPGAQVWVNGDHAALFLASIPALVYSGARDAAFGDVEAIEHGSRKQITAGLEHLGIRYVIVQTAQPPLHIFSVCGFDRPLGRSGPVTVSAQSQYTFELYAVNGCPAPQIRRVPDAQEQSKTLRREQAAVILADLQISGKGLGAAVRGNKRDPNGYGFEHNYLNLMHKFGIFALVIFAVYATTLARMAFAARRFHTRHLALASAAFAAGLIMGFGNPMLMSPVVVTLHVIVLYWLRPIEPWRPASGAMRP